ncbi:MAG: MarR family winged helix-turn-helix transcriptional regulator [Burkholderiaceae bacterium]
MNARQNIDRHATIREEEVCIPSDLSSGSVDLVDFLSVRIFRLNSVIERQTRELLAASGGLSTIEWRCLAALCIHGAQTVSEVAVVCYENASQISRALRAMRDKNLVAWSAGSLKRGYGPVDVTEAGRSLYAHVKPIMQARNLWLLGEFAPKEMRTLYAMIARLRHRMAAAPDLEALTAGAEYRHLARSNHGLPQGSRTNGSGRRDTETRPAQGRQQEET